MVQIASSPYRASRTANDDHAGRDGSSDDGARPDQRTGTDGDAGQQHGAGSDTGFVLHASPSLALVVPGARRVKIIGEDDPRPDEHSVADNG